MGRALNQSKQQRPVRYQLIAALLSLLLLPLLSLAAVAQLGWPNLPALREAVQQEQQASPALNAYLEALETELSRLQERYRQQEAQIERLTGDLDTAQRQLASLSGQAEPLSEPLSTLSGEELPLALPSSGTVDPAQDDAAAGQPAGSGAEAAAETAEATEATGAVESGIDPEAVETTEELYDYLPKARPILREQMDETRAPSVFPPLLRPTAPRIDPSLVSGVGNGQAGSVEVQIFTAAQALNEQARWDEAEAAWSQFSLAYRSSPQLAEAFFYRGEAQFSLGQHSAALQSFSRSYRYNRQSPVAAQALLYTGLSAQRSGERSRACLAFRGLLAQHPQAEAGILAQARAALETCPTS